MINTGHNYGADERGGKPSKRDYNIDKGVSHAYPFMDANAAGDSGLTREQVIAKVKEAADDLVIVELGSLSQPFPQLMSSTLTEFLTAVGESIDSLCDEFNDGFEESPAGSGKYRFINDPDDPEYIYVDIVNGVAMLFNCDNDWILENQKSTHEHDYANTWSSDATSHWKACNSTTGDCDTPKKDVADHSFLWITDVPATATTAGKKHEECRVCKYKRSENTVIPATGGGNSGNEKGPGNPTPSGASTSSTSPKTGESSTPYAGMVLLIASAFVFLTVTKKREV